MPYRTNIDENSPLIEVIIIIIELGVKFKILEKPLPKINLTRANVIWCEAQCLKAIHLSSEVELDI